MCLFFNERIKPSKTFKLGELKNEPDDFEKFWRANPPSLSFLSPSLSFQTLSLSSPPNSQTDPKGREVKALGKKRGKNSPPKSSSS